MKTRMGFVSNSSSSSFIICSDMDIKDINFDRICQINHASPFYYITNEIREMFVNNAQEININSPTTEQCYEDAVPTILKRNLHNKYKKFYQLEVSSDNMNSMEHILNDLTFEYKDDQCLIIKEGY